MTESEKESRRKREREREGKTHVSKSRMKKWALKIIS
jgi:hypothetical protein